ncbi:MAG: hypothetical protein WCK72_04620 [Actinomycetes bacterium]
MTSPMVERTPSKVSAIKLTKPGVIVLQSLFLALFALLELIFRHGIGIITGLAICLVVIGGIRFGRPGTSYVAAVTPPIAFAGVVLLAIIGIDGLHPSKVGLDFIASLASAAPYLIIGASYGWLNFFQSRKKQKELLTSA